MLGISYESAVNNSLISIRNASYETEFFIKDGENLRMYNSYDGQTRSYPCKFIDHYHFYFGSNVFHIDQFAEFINRNGHRCEPEKPITDLELFDKAYFNREFVGKDGKPLPYRKIVIEHSPHNSWDIQFCAAVCPEAPRGYQVCIFTLTGNVTGKEFMSAEDCLSRLDRDLALHLGKWDKVILEAIVTDIARSQHRESHKSLNSIIASAQKQSSELSSDPVLKFNSITENAR